MECGDVMKKIPHKLCSAIANYLYFEDLLRIRLVSKSWNQAFSKTDICAHAIQKQCSFPLEHFFKNYGVNYAELDDEMKNNCHRKFMINRIRREHGIASKIYELDYDLTEIKEPFFLYSEGRVAICYDEKIIVEDLNTRQISVFEYPPNAIRRIAGSPRLVGNFLISSFTYEGRDAQLVIWNIFTKCMHLYPTFKIVFSSTSYQNQVGLVVTNSSFYGQQLSFLTWDEESGLKKLMDIEGFEDPNERNLSARVFFHPTKKDVVFITLQTRIYSKFESSKYGTRITVYCYEKEELINTQQKIIYTSTLPAEYETNKFNNDNQISFMAREPPFGWKPPNLRPYIFVKKELPNGQEPNFIWVPKLRSEGSSAPNSEEGVLFDQEPPFDNEQRSAGGLSSNFEQESFVRWIEQPCGFMPVVVYRKSIDEAVYEYLIYNMDNGQFSLFKTHLHPTYNGCLFRHGILTWNDQILIRACHNNVEKLQVVTLSKSLSGLWNGSMGNADIPSSSYNRSSIMRGETRSNFKTTPFEFDDKLQDNPDIRVYGDDNFVILRVGKIAKVWQFDRFKY